MTKYDKTKTRGKTMNVYQTYTRIKRYINTLDLTPEQYEKLIQAIAKALEI